jgi:hypothetical protein
MKAIGRRLTYANVVSTIALFLVLAGGAAYAAKVAKKSVGPSQLKANAVTTAKIKANSITTRKIKRNAIANAKIKDGAVESEKIADGSVSFTDLDSTTMPFSRVVRKARGSSPLAITEALKTYPLSEATFTQAANENDSFIGALDVTFSADCKAPRDVTAYLLLDALKPPAFETGEVVAFGYSRDESGAGAVSRRVEIGPGGDPGGTGAVATGTRFEPGSTKNRKLSLVVKGSCSTGTGITAGFAGVNVIATK